MIEENLNTSSVRNYNFNVIIDNIDNINALIANIDAVNSVGTNIVNVNSVGASSANVDIVATSIANVNSIVTNIINIDNVGNNIANVVAVGGDITNVNTIAGNLTNINTVATNDANVTAVGEDIANVNTVAGAKINIDAVALNKSNIDTVAGASVAVGQVSANIDNVNAISARIASIDTIATNIAVILASSQNATDAAASAASALANKNATDDNVTATNADVVLTNADVVKTNADVVKTNADVVKTAADAVLTGNDVVSTNANVTSCNDSVAEALVHKNDAEASKIAAGLSATASGNSADLAAAEVASIGTSVTDCEADANRAETAEASASVHATTAQTESAKLANYNSMTSLERALPTANDFNARAEANKIPLSGSGFVEFGKHNDNGISVLNVNDGIYTWNGGSNYFFWGRGATATTLLGNSKTRYPMLNANGINLILKHINLNSGEDLNKVELPTAPTVTHADASNSGMVLNGRNMVDASGWASPYQSLASAVGGNLRITANGGTNPYVTQGIRNAVVGETYVVEFNRKETDSASTNFRLLIGSTHGQLATDTIFNQPAPNKGRYTFEVTAVSTDLFLQFTGAQMVDGEYFDVGEIAIMPKKELSRSDLVFLETWHEDISEKDFVYPLGNIQYLGADTDGLTGIVAGAFAGKETYSNFGNWQADNALVGKGYAWSTMSEANKIAFVSNPENNCYIDGTTIVQVRYRVRVVQGLGDEWGNITTQNSVGAMAYDTNHRVSLKGKLVSIDDLVPSATPHFYDAGNNNYPYPDTGVFYPYSTNGTNSAYDRKIYALPIALVHRRNQGAYHPKFNPNGTDRIWDINSVLGSQLWYSPTAHDINSVADTFTYNGKENGEHFGSIISTFSGKPDGLFYDEVNERDIIDLRNSSHKVQDYKRLLEREFNKAVAGEVRGEEGEWEILNKISGAYIGESNNTYAVGDVIYINLSGDLYGLGSPSYYDGTDRDILDDTKKFFIADQNGKYWEGYSVYFDGSLTRIHIHPKYDRATVALAFGAAVTHDVYYAKQSTRKKSNTLLHCDIIGDPANYYRGQTFTNTGVETVDLAVGDVVWHKGSYAHATTGATQNVTTSTNGKVYYEVASGTTGVGTVGYIYVSKNSRSIDLDTEDFTNATNWDVIGTLGNFFKRLTVGAGTYLPNQNYMNVTNYEDLGADWDGAGSWRTGVSGTPLVVGEEGEDYITSLGTPTDYKLSKKAKTLMLVLASTDNGVTWNIASLTLDATANTINFTGASNGVYLCFYETHTNMTENAVNSEVIELGDAKGWRQWYNTIDYVVYLGQSLIGKILRMTGVSVDNGVNKTIEGVGLSATGTAIGEPIHSVLNIGGSDVDRGFKVLPYISKENNKAYLNLVFKEMKFDVDWGDDSKFNIVDNVSTTTDDNANTVLIGQKRIELPYFIEDKE